jgi:hypothetical protein
MKKTIITNKELPNFDKQVIVNLSYGKEQTYEQEIKFAQQILI